MCKDFNVCCLVTAQWSKDWSQTQHALSGHRHQQKLYITTHHKQQNGVTRSDWQRYCRRDKRNPQKYKVAVDFVVIPLRTSWHLLLCLPSHVSVMWMHPTGRISRSKNRKEGFKIRTDFSLSLSPSPVYCWVREHVWSWAVCLCGLGVAVLEDQCVIISVHSQLLPLCLLLPVCRDWVASTAPPPHLSCC